LKFVNLKKHEVLAQCFETHCFSTSSIKVVISVLKNSLCPSGGIIGMHKFEKYFFYISENFQHQDLIQYYGGGAIHPLYPSGPAPPPPLQKILGTPVGTGILLVL